ncbi:MAG: DUF4340 domain-containing protein [Spirobacillus cienkowskii]|jgi:hypothetical protein|uniref:DUF4340 domain-containing protein n=1 Tax=Spirobacillus cienkowskii TaxID=495820 RepID=A0A369KR76_9BACT|nr:MAG: DUF4340 domain-containing protein [Spirobacillus cienkowskii]
MKFSQKVGFGIFAILGLSAIYYGDDYYTNKKEERLKETAHAIFFETKDVLNFSVKNKANTFTFARDNNESPWRILKPVELSADQDTINNVLSAVQQLTVQQEVPNTEALLTGDKKQLAQYGLDNALNSVTIERKGKDSLQLLLGNKLGFIKSSNEQAAGFSSVYAINPAKNKLLVVSDMFSSVIEDKTLADFRTKRIGNFTGQNVTEIELNYNKENLLVQKNNNLWEVLKPHKWKGDDNFISDYLSRYQGLLADKVYEKNEITKNLIEKFNLKNPSAIVTFKDANQKILQKFELSITKEGIYITMVDGSVAKLSLDLWPDLVPKEKSFRNKLIMLNINTDSISRIVLSDELSFVRKDNNWYRTTSTTQQPSVSETPSQDAFNFFSNWELMSADDIILNPSNADLEYFGITKPLKVFYFEFNEAAKIKPIKIIVGNRVPKNEKNVYLKRSDLSSVYIVETDWLSQLAQLYSVGDSSHISVQKQME